MIHLTWSQNSKMPGRRLFIPHLLSLLSALFPTVQLRVLVSWFDKESDSRQRQHRVKVKNGWWRARWMWETEPFLLDRVAILPCEAYPHPSDTVTPLTHYYTRPEDSELSSKGKSQRLPDAQHFCLNVLNKEFGSLKLPYRWGKWDTKKLLG